MIRIDALNFNGERFLSAGFHKYGDATEIETPPGAVLSPKGRHNPAPAEVVFSAPCVW
jgi:hypothetical protein